MTTHDLKCWPESFAPILHGQKTFEVRKNDRGYAVGDTLILREFSDGQYTGPWLEAEVTYALAGQFGVGSNIVMSIKLGRSGPDMISIHTEMSGTAPSPSAEPPDTEMSDVNAANDFLALDEVAGCWQVLTQEVGGQGCNPPFQVRVFYWETSESYQERYYRHPTREAAVAAHDRLCVVLARTTPNACSLGDIPELEIALLNESRQIQRSSRDRIER